MEGTKKKKKVIIRYKGKTKMEFLKECFFLSLSVCSILQFWRSGLRENFFQTYLRPNFKSVNNNKDMTYFVMSHDYHDEVDIYL